MDFNFLMPTKVISGRDCILKNAQIFSSLGKKAIIVTGKHSAKKSGALNQVVEALSSVSISYKIYDQVEPNPSVDCVCKGGELAKSFGADFVIGIGGGSPMDAAKAIALLARNPWNENLFNQTYKNHPLPICAVPTTAGTGSEVTQYSIITDEQNQTKRSIATADIFPRYSFLDGTFMVGLSNTTTINTVIDAFSHAAEGYLSKRANFMSDRFAEQSISILGKYLFDLNNKKMTVEERDELLYASMLAGIVIAQTGTTIVHGMGYSLTYFKHIDHGRANGLLFHSFLKFTQREQSGKIEKILSLLKLSSLDQFKTQMQQLLSPIEKFNDEELISFSHKAIKTGNVNNTTPIPNREDILKIFRESLQ